ncbi:uncharacterized protein LOC134067038 [Sardina pilchardus]|uniref:uncharacterized protein LOC134067038 n=1 Tax=Sardina pilchardus TaxID=27697 RepID=UPI002E15805D
MVRQHNKNSPKTAYHMDTFAITAMWQKKPVKLKLDPTSYSIILGIVHDCHHWFLVAIYPSEKKTIIVDSLGESALKIKRCLETTRALMRKMDVAVSRWTCTTVTHPLQRDATSCGVFALKFAEHILSDTPMQFSANKEKVDEMRKEIAESILSHSDDLSNLCHHCGEAETFDDSKEVVWISCDYCDRWFHVGCVGNPSLDKDYSCYACVK